MRSPLAPTAALLLALAGCAARPEHFTPTERPTAVSREGFVAAQYDAIVGGQVIGDVKVWSAGAYEDEDTGRTMLQVGLDVENNGDEPMQLALGDFAIEGIEVDGRATGPAELLGGPGDARLRPGDTGHFDLHFRLPAGVRPQHLDGFQVSWAVSTSRGRYAQRTPFIEQEPRGYYTAGYSDDPFYPADYYGAPYRPVHYMRPVPTAPRTIQRVHHHHR
jgi:hypothetical protein